MDFDCNRQSPSRLNLKQATTVVSPASQKELVVGKAGTARSLWSGKLEQPVKQAVPAVRCLAQK